MNMIMLVSGLIVLTSFSFVVGEEVGGDPRRVRFSSNGVSTPPLHPLQWGTVSPRGWIKDWAVAGANGAVSPINSWFATGDIKNGRSNGWMKGQAPWPMDEQSAYWIDGMTRLGLVLNDPTLKARTAEDIAAVIKNDFFGEPGGGGPEGWPRSVYSRAMLAYFDATGDDRVVPFFAKVWNSSYEMDSAPDARSLTQSEAMLEGYAYGGSEDLKMVALRGLTAHQASFITAWAGPRCSDYSVNSSCVTASYELEHGVTWNELAKIWALAAPWSHEEASSSLWMKMSTNAYKLMGERDLLPYGVNSGQEALSGVAPNASTETCDVSDFIHSNTWLLRNSGNAHFGDSLERAFHNAAPGTLNRDYTEHVYYQSPNLVTIPKDFIEYGHNVSKRWIMNVSHTPPCCTGNQARLLPNYIHHMWTFSGEDGGLVASMYGPNEVTTAVRGGVKVNVVVETDYPFDTDVKMTVNVMQHKAAVFPLHLRVPAWCTNPSIEINGVAVNVKVNELGYHNVTREWATGDVVQLVFPMTPSITTSLTINNGGLDNNHNSNRNNFVQGGRPYATVSMGPLLFALALEEDNTHWNYALVANQTLKLNRHTMPTHWDWPLDTPPVTVTALAMKVPQWKNEWDLPKTPVQMKASDVPVEIELVPYGCSKVFKISMFPHTTTPTE
eukprot:m.258178 g.258178  ORF g.258178 m.258178 type:complete len:667 (-) comp36246_c0_seq1:227-2227(-)